MHLVVWSLLALSFAGVASSPLEAQEPAAAYDLADRAPRFMVSVAESAAPSVVDASSVAALRRRISLDMADVTLEEALTAISREAGLRLMYSKAVVPLESRVRLQAKGITVAGALSEVLLDARVDVLLTANGQAVLVKRRAAEAVAMQNGSLAGRVTDAKTGEGLVGAEVLLEGTRWRTGTAEEGRYRLTEVEPASYRLTVRRIGYAKQRQPVTVVSDQETTVDVALEPVPTQLNELVTTATGEQRLLELGHVVGRINADSVVREAPVSNLSELLTSRVPGLMVLQNQGTVGGKVDVRIRGANSLILGPEPIVVVDGVRYTTALRPMGAASDRFGFIPGPANVEPTSPLNDINVNDIESVEVVKGPSAATLYGSDAANGVIVITTKRGRPGPARWNLHAKGTTTEIPASEFPDINWGWGTVFGVPNSTTTNCTLFWLGLGVCSQQDSITVLPNPLNDPQLSIFDSKPTWEYGANVAGGQGDLRYYFSADLQDATGPIQMPPAVASQLMQQRGLRELPDEWRNPNTSSRLGLRSNVTAALSDAADLRLSAGYIQASTRTLGATNPYGATLSTTPTTPYGGGGAAPVSSFLMTSTEDLQRFFASAASGWRIRPWLETRGTVGLDLTSSNRHSLARRGDAVDLPGGEGLANGAVGDDDGRQLEVTVDLGATATLRRGRVSSRTTVGAQYVRDFTNSLFIYGTDLPPGGTSVQEALSLQSHQTRGEATTLGSYLEQTVGLNERLFLTGALRLDGASTFGRDYNAALYPKAGFSWLASEEPFVPRLPGLEELRLRYAFGASGRQPLPRWGLPDFFGTTTIINGVVERTVVNSGLGNPDLRPERVSEHEFGFDARALGSRVSLGLTWFRRRARDQIINVQMPPGLGNAYVNLGLTTQRGFEAEVTARVLDTRPLSFDLRLQHSTSTTDLESLGDAPASRDIRGGYVEGYPLGARFGLGVSGYEDTNGDGIIDITEVVPTDTTVYMGQSLPPKSQTLTTVLSFLDRRLRLSALAERRAGFTQVNPYFCRFPGTCRAGVDRSTPLAEQARTVGTFFTGGSVEKGNFIRLREVSLAVDLPAAAVRALRLGSATLAFSARNLALWTDFSGPDPESAALFLSTELGAVRGNQADGVPLGRSYELRIDLGF